MWSHWLNPRQPLLFLPPPSGNVKIGRGANIYSPNRIPFSAQELLSVVTGQWWGGHTYYHEVKSLSEQLAPLLPHPQPLELRTGSKRGPEQGHSYRGADSRSAESSVEHHCMADPQTTD